MRNLVIILLCVYAAGCSHVVSRETRSEAEAQASVRALFEDPAAFSGKTLIVGGVIINTTNAEEETIIEVLEKPLDYRGRPKHTDVSRGRFIVIHEGYLEKAIYAPGREITVAGEVTGVSTLPVGERPYRYPVISSREIHLIKPRGGPSIRFGIGVFHSF